jgi:hypothetical protein
MERIRQNHFHRINPFYINQVKRINLAAGEVDAIVFWRKNRLAP